MVLQSALLGERLLANFALPLGLARHCREIAACRSVHREQYVSRKDRSWPSITCTHRRIVGEDLVCSARLAISHAPQFCHAGVS